MRNQSFALILAALIVSACAANPSPAVRGIQETDASRVKGCEPLGGIHGSSILGGLAASTAMGNAKNEALEQAVEKGATHVVWGNVEGNYNGASASGQAYRC